MAKGKGEGKQEEGELPPINYTNPGWTWHHSKGKGEGEGEGDVVVEDSLTRTRGAKEAKKDEGPNIGMVDPGNHSEGRVNAEEGHGNRSEERMVEVETLGKYSGSRKSRKQGDDDEEQGGQGGEQGESKKEPVRSGKGGDGEDGDDGDDTVGQVAGVKQVASSPAPVQSSPPEVPLTPTPFSVPETPQPLKVTPHPVAPTPAPLDTGNMGKGKGSPAKNMTSTPVSARVVTPSPIRNLTPAPVDPTPSPVLDIPNPGPLLTPSPIFGKWGSTGNGISKGEGGVGGGGVGVKEEEGTPVVVQRCGQDEDCKDTYAECVLDNVSKEWSCACRAPWQGIPGIGSGCSKPDQCSLLASCIDCLDANSEGRENGPLGCTWRVRDSQYGGSCVEVGLPLPLDAIETCEDSLPSLVPSQAKQEGRGGVMGMDSPPYFLVMGVLVMVAVLLGLVGICVQCRQRSKAENTGSNYVEVPTGQESDGTGGDNWDWETGEGSDIEMAPLTATLKSQVDSGSHLTSGLGMGVGGIASSAPMTSISLDNGLSVGGSRAESTTLRGVRGGVSSGNVVDNSGRAARKIQGKGTVSHIDAPGILPDDDLFAELGIEAKPTFSGRPPPQRSQAQPKNSRCSFGAVEVEGDDGANWSDDDLDNLLDS